MSTVRSYMHSTRCFGPLNDRTPSSASKSSRLRNWRQGTAHGPHAITCSGGCLLRQNDDHPPTSSIGATQENIFSIPCSQRRVGVDKWHCVLGELRSMALAFPGARVLFNQMQEALCHVKVKSVTLSLGVHEALSDFRCLAEDVANRPTRMYELVTLRPTVDGYHDASSYMCGGVVLPGPTAIPRSLPPQPSAARPSPNPNRAHPIVWRMTLPKDIVDYLVSWTNPRGTVNNS